MHLQSPRNAHALRSVDPDLIGQVMASVIRSPPQDADRALGQPPCDHRIHLTAIAQKVDIQAILSQL